MANGSRVAHEIQIAAVDGALADQTRLWHAQPLLTKVRRLNQGNFWPRRYNRYGATQEWIAYGEVRSILSTTTLAQLQDLAENNDSVEMILRLEIVQAARWMSHLRANFFAQQVALAHSSIIGLACILLFLKITPVLSIEVIEAGVYEIIQGWAVKIPDEAIVKEAFGQWVYYFLQDAKNGEHDNNDGHDNINVAAARQAFIAGCLRAKTDLEREAKRYESHKTTSAAAIIPSSSASSRVVIASTEESEFDEQILHEYDLLEDMMDHASRS
jgi:hypothetical protein